MRQPVEGQLKAITGIHAVMILREQPVELKFRDSLAWAAEDV